MNKTLIVARREYLATVRRKGFVIATIGMPVFLVVVYGIAGGAAFLADRQSKAKNETVGIVDESGLVQFRLLQEIGATVTGGAAQVEKAQDTLRDSTLRRTPGLAGNVHVQPFASRAEAKSAYQRKNIRGYYIIPADFLDTGIVQLEIKKGGFMADNEPGWNLVRRLVQASLVEGRIEEKMARRLWTPPALKSVAINDAGQPDKRGQFTEVSTFVVPYVFTIFFMISIMSSAGYLMQGVSEEKENRVIEILLSSVTPNELLAGKVIGLCGAGLTQISAWILMGVVPALYLLPFLDLRWSQLVVAMIFFPLGFFLYGTLMGGSASLGNNFRESQQASMIWSLSAVVPMFFLTLILSQPNGTLARVLSYIPLTAPITIMMRIGATQVPWWDIALSAAILLASQFLFVRLAAKLFRIGTLMYGKRPSLVEIIRWLRTA